LRKGVSIEKKRLDGWSGGAVVSHLRDKDKCAPKMGTRGVGEKGRRDAGGVVVSHPFPRKKAKRWGTGAIDEKWWVGIYFEAVSRWTTRTIQKTKFQAEGL
jgi:hypothetical protein